MARIELENLTVEYPIYQAESMSLRNTLISFSTGGTISRGSRNTMMVKALDSISFSVKDGDRIGLLGHNGAGKSTLLHTLAGIYTPTSGSLTIEGKTSAILQLGVGLDPDLNGYDNIIRMGMLLGKTKTQAALIVDDVAEFSELGAFLSIPVRTYSAGMMTRLTFGTITAVEPEILLIDEVLGAGDARFQEKAKMRIENILTSARIFLLASHSQPMIELYCNRIMRFEHGQIIEDYYIS